MSRRRRIYVTNRFEDGSRSSVGDYYVDQACDNLNAACAKEAAMFVAGLTVHDVIPIMFNDDAVTRLKAVHGLLGYEENHRGYDLKPWLNGQISIYTDGIMPPPHEAAREWHADRAGTLVTAVQALNELHVKWGAVKHLLRWFNRNATPGAVRANWPSVLTLCPDAPSLKELQHAPTRYTNPQELSSLLPLIRATSTTVASMAMLPGDAKPRPRGTVVITIPARTADYEGTQITLDSQTFSL